MTTALVSPVNEQLTSAIMAARDGDDQAFEVIYRETVLELKSWIAYHSYHWDMIEECLQQTYIAAFHGLPTFELDRPLIPWLKGIARHQIGKYLRSQQRLKQREHQAFLQQQQIRLDQDDPLLAEEQGISDRLSQCLQKLNQRLRGLVWRRYVDRASVNEIAESEGKTVNALNVLFFRTRRSLQQCVENAENAENAENL